MKLKCSHPGCDYVASHPTGYARNMMGKHMSRAHGQRFSVRKQYPPKPPTPEVPEVAKPPRKKYERQAVTGLNFCPCCGTNLRAVRVAIEL